MKTLFAVSLMIFLAGCGSSSKAKDAAADDVNNSTTRYVDNLMDDEKRAASAVKQYNRGVQKEETAGREAGADQ